MIDHDQLANFLDDALPPGPRSEVERELAGDEEALQFVIEHRKLDRTLRSLLGPAAKKQRLKESILSTAVGATSEELRARILADTSRHAGAPARDAGTSSVELQRTNSSYPREGSDLAGKLRDWVRENIQILERLARARFALSAVAVIVSVLGILFYGLLQKPAARIEVGQIASVVGSPTLRHSNQGQAIKAQRSTVVCLGDRIETGDADRTEIRFRDGTTLGLNFNTTLEIPKAPVRQSTHPRNYPFTTLSRPAEVDLLAGQLWSKVTKSTNGAQFVIRTPVASASVKGTEFGLKLKQTAPSAGLPQPSKAGSSTPKLVAVLTVKEGAVEFSNSYGKVEATGMTESTATPDSAPSQPLRLKTLKSFVAQGNKNVKILSEAPIVDPNTAGIRLVYPLGWAGFLLKTPAKTQFDSNPPAGPLRVTRVWPGSPAANAGLSVGDLVTEVNGRTATNLLDVLIPAIRQPNAHVNLTVLHGGMPMRVSFTTTEHPYALPMTNLPSGVAAELFDATWPLIERACSGNGTNVNWSKVAEKLEQLQGRHPGLAAIHNNLAVCYEAEDKVDGAIGEFRQAIQLEPNNALYHLNLGRVLCNIGNFERSVDEMEAALRLAPSWTPAVYGFAQSCFVIERSGEALNALEQGSRANPLDADLFNYRALILTANHRLDEALVAVTRAAELDSFYYSSLGNIEWSRYDFDAAEAAKRKVIELDPDSAYPYAALAMIILNRLGSELDIYHDAMVAPLDPLRFDRLINGDTAKLARLGEVERLLRKAISLNPQDPRIYDRFATYYQHRGQLEQAIAMWTKAKELDPDPENTAYCNYALANNLAIWGVQLGEALDLAQTAVQLVPRGLYVDTLAFVHFRRGEFEQAEQAFKRCIELGEPDEAEDWFHLGKVYERQNRLEAAIGAYEKVIRLRPDYSDASNALQQLRR